MTTAGAASAGLNGSVMSVQAEAQSSSLPMRSCVGCSAQRDDGWEGLADDYYCPPCWEKHWAKERKAQEEKQKENFLDANGRNASPGPSQVKADMCEPCLPSREPGQGCLQRCTECQAFRDDGWTGAGGDYFCRVCWQRHWEWFAVSPSRTASQRSEQDTDTLAPQKKRSKRFLGLPWRLRFACCCPLRQRGVSRSFELTDEAYSALDEPYSPGYGFGSWCPQPDSPDLCGLEFCDAHCHLDMILQNAKHGGPGWDSKQKLCSYWLFGECPYGENCFYAHGEENREARQPLELSDIEPFMEQHAKTMANAQAPQACKGARGSKLKNAVLRCMITNFCELASICDTSLLLQIAERILGGIVFFTFGCHPHNYREYNDDMESKMLAELKKYGDHAVAWGECGLDYCKNEDESEDPVERQRMVEVFARQARLAVAHKLPLVVHSRDAEEDTLMVLRDCLPRDHKVHVHAFQGSVDMMQKTLAMMPNSLFGVSGILTMPIPIEAAEDIARYCPLDRLVLETDAPYLCNGPYDIPALALKVAELKGISAAKVMEATSVNCLRFYGIG